MSRPRLKFLFITLFIIPWLFSAKVVFALSIWAGVDSGFKTIAVFSSFIEDFNRLSAETLTSMSSANLVSEVVLSFTSSTMPFILFFASK